jgi:hypothetical protein
MCVVQPDVSAKELVMPSKKPPQPRKKIAVLPAKTRKGPNPPGAWVDSEGLTGEGSESVMTHLRELEKLRAARRLEKTGKDKGE